MAEGIGLHRHLHGVGLTGIEHVQRNNFLHLHKLHTGRVQPQLAAGCRRGHAFTQVSHVQFGQCFIQCLYGVVAHVSHYATQR